MRRVITRTSKPSYPKFDLSHPVIKAADHHLSFSNRGIYDEKAGVEWTSVTTNGTTEYAHDPINGSMHFVRQDIDESGIVYQAPLNGLDPATNPLFFVLSYTVLSAPTGSSKAFIQIGNSTRDGSPLFNRTSESTTTFRSWIGGWQFAGTPVNVGEKHLLIVRYDGINHWDFYDSADGVWQTLTNAASNGGVSAGFWLGTGFAAELPVAFEYFVGGIGNAPPLEAFKDVVKNPYQLFAPQIRNIDVIVPIVSGVSVFRRRMIMRKSA